MACSACRKRAKSVKKAAPKTQQKTRTLSPRKVINPNTSSAKVSFSPTQPQSKKQPPRATNAVKIK